MQIASNTTGMLAEVCCAIDRHGREHALVVIKGRFIADAAGNLRPDDEQAPLVFADEHYGTPEGSSVRFPSDFAPEKPLTDVLVVGKAVAPGGEPVHALTVRLDVEGRSKELSIRGERRWLNAGAGVVASDPVPFTEMPITFERAWGGQDDSGGPEHVALELRNPVGVGFSPHRSTKDLDGMPLPNVEAAGAPVVSPRANYEPAGFGNIGRGWQPRIALAGTYDARWREHQAPFLPEDFDVRYHQSAPPDQQFSRFRGGERLQCLHMAERTSIGYVVPALELPVLYRFLDRDECRAAELDTVILEPHLARATLVWRASVPLPKKLTLLREIRVGKAPRGALIGYRGGKPHFSGLGAAIANLRRRRYGGT